MKSAILFTLLIILLPVVVVIQDLLPALPPNQERIVLLPVLFCFGALALPLIPALFFALVVATVQGLLLIQIESGVAEFTLIEPVVFFLGWTMLLQMAREALHGIRWELHALGSALVTVTLLGGEFLMLCMKRGGFPVESTVLLRIGMPSIVALLLAPILYLLLGALASDNPVSHMSSIKPVGQDS